MVQCVYKISCVDENIKEFYIGSTDDLNRRIIEHKSRYNSGYDYNVYKFIRENGGISNWEINPIEIFSFLTVLELKEHEQFYLDEYKPKLNTQNAIRPKNYRDKYKEYFRLVNNKKINCPHCNKQLNKSSLKRHIKSQHPTSI